MYMEEEAFDLKDVTDVIIRALDGRDYGIGELEAISDTAYNTSKAIARLLNLLENKGLINKQELYEVVTGYESEYFKSKKR